MSRCRTFRSVALAAAILFALVTSLPAHRRLSGSAMTSKARNIGTLVINEVDSDTPSTDTAEFVELFDGGVGNSPLDGYVVVFYNGGDDLSYAAFDLDGSATNPAGFFTLGNSAVPGVDVTFANGRLQNGPDAVALFAANAADFPNGTPLTITNLVDAITYSNGTTIDTGLLALLNTGQLQINENGAGTGATVSMQRIPNGLGGERNTNSYQVMLPTPDGPNLSPTVAPVSLSGRVTDAQGNGIRGARMTIESGVMPESRSALTSSFGYYSFDGLSTGTYLVTINSKRYAFAVPSRLVTMNDNVTSFDFVAEPQE
ncbi:MAG: carboxypeptidase-like regulatory domain-containing protein [Acidobacteriota bacterium]